jgi:hypothetical protein
MAKQKEKPKPFMGRLYNVERQIIKKIVRAYGCSKAEAVRLALREFAARIFV